MVFILIMTGDPKGGRNRHSILLDLRLWKVHIIIDRWMDK